jgi:hypothetical protein
MGFTRCLTKKNEVTCVGTLHELDRLEMGMGKKMHKGTIEALKSVIRFGPECLPKPEFMMLLFHAERTLLSGKVSDTVSLSEQERGIYQCNGRRVAWIRGGCGLAAPSVAKANRALESLGLLRRTRHSNERDGHTPTEYEVIWPAVHSYFAEKQDSKAATLVA